MRRLSKAVIGGALVTSLAGCGVLSPHEGSNQRSNNEILGSRARMLASEVLIDISTHELQPGTLESCLYTGFGSNVELWRTVGRFTYDGSVWSNGIDLCTSPTAMANPSQATLRTIGSVSIEKVTVNEIGRVENCNGLTAIEEDEGGNWSVRHYYVGGRDGMSDKNLNVPSLDDKTWLDLIQI